MTKVTRLNGMSFGNSYVVSVFVSEGRVDRIDVSGKPNASVLDACRYFARIHATLHEEAIKAIKNIMIDHLEYRGSNVQCMDESGHQAFG